MRKYDFTPELLDALPEELAELYRGLEDTLLMEICARLKAADELNEVTVQDIKALRAHGIDLKDIEKAIRKTTGISEQKLKKLLDDVVARNQAYYTELITLADVTQPDVLVDAAAIAAIYAQTKQECRNITRSMGFLVDSGRTMMSPAKAYQWCCDSALMQIQSGAISYNQAISNAVKQLADSGLKTVDYESGHRDQVDVAARRAVMKGVNALNQKYAEQSADYLETDLVEVSAHIGARNTGNGLENHESWQGGVYRWAEKPGDSKGEYKDFVATTGYGLGAGLGGWNCRHTFYPFVEGVSEPTYSQADLDTMKSENRKFVFDGKEYDGYTATQMQRSIERQIRKQKRLRDAYKAAGLKDDETSANIKLRRLNAKYKEFSKAAGLPEQSERLKVLYSDTKSTAAAQALKAQRQAEAAQVALQNEKNIAILKEKIANGDISTAIRPQVQASHIEGTVEFERYKAQRLANGQTPQSIMTITMQEAQKFVDSNVGTGTVVVQTQKSGAVKIIEYTNADRVIGRYYKDNAYHNTKRGGIYYSKKGTHVVPTSPKEDK
nr:MAG TPA: minor capsid protein [Caudoviricetes sp.]